jgi:hypothetical protein
MILQITQDIGYFLVILASTLCAFSQAFWILSSSNISLLFGSSIQNAYIYSFMFMMGQNVDPNVFQDSASFPLCMALLILFMLFMVVLMLNLLIALMSDSYATVTEKGLAQWRWEQASIILEDTNTQNEKVPPYLHVLQYTSALRFSEDSDTVHVSKLDKAAQALDDRFQKLHSKITSTINGAMLAKEKPIIDHTPLLSSTESQRDHSFVAPSPAIFDTLSHQHHTQLMDSLKSLVRERMEGESLKEKIVILEAKLDMIVSKAVGRKVVRREA